MAGFKNIKGISYDELTLDASKDGVQKAEQLAARFVDKKGRLLTDAQIGDGGAVETINRESVRKQVLKLMRIMLRGVNVPLGWQEKGSEELVMTESGYLKDGRHRMLAFIEAAKVNPALKITFILKKGVPDDEAAAVNINRQPQSLRDIASANGYVKFNASVSKFIYNRGMGNSRSLPDEDVLEMLRQWDSSINEVKANLTEENGNPKLKVGTAQVVAAITRGFLSAHIRPDGTINPDAKKMQQARNAIMRFCEVLGGAMPDKGKPEECHPYGLSKIFLSRNGSQKVVECKRDYDTAEFALQMYLEKAPSCDIKMARRELFPLPGEASPIKKGNIAYLIPVASRGRTTMEDMAEKMMETGQIFLDSLNFKRIKARSAVCVYLPRGGKVFAVGRAGKVEMVAGSPALKINGLVRVKEMPEITPAKLIQLSLSERGRVPEVEKLAKQATKLYDSDISILVDSSKAGTAFSR